MLLLACLAAANMPQDTDDTPSRVVRTPRAVTPDALAADVSVQAARLHDAMAQAPTPGASPRNPFTFSAAPASHAQPATVHAAVADEPAPVFAAPLPPLLLMGVAEETTPKGPRRTAIIGGEAETIYMVAEGDAVGDRYRVTKIGADAVELEDVLTKAYRRLALR
jgi:Tfp pilus assembly protein PilP